MRVAEISLPAIRHNVHRIRELTGGAVIAVMKANGYGHGAVHCARAAIEAGAAIIGVADLEEALALREAGIDGPILCWLHGVRVDWDAAVDAGIEVGISHLSQLEGVAAAAGRAGRTADVQFKLDTGLSRNGAGVEEWTDLFARGAELVRSGEIRVRGVFSHMANAGEEHDLVQAARFDEALALLRGAGIEPEFIHLAASAATFARPGLYYNTVRVGMAVYGCSPFPDRTSAELGLIPAMTLRSEIVGLRAVPEGTGVSYGYNHVTQGGTTLALVPMGYADGMPRALNGAGATVAIAGTHCPIVGRIGMDQCIVDVGSLARKVSVGEPVVLFGDPSTGVPPAEVWSEVLGTIVYEVVVGIGPRVLRVAVDHLPGAPDEDVLVPAAGDRSGEPVSQRFDVSDPERMHELGVELGGRLAAGDLVILTGPLGAGKTTLTRGIGEGLGVRGPVTSPTFVLARTHPSLVDGPPLIHLDAYRLADAAELDDLDLDFDGSVVVAEWGAGMLEERGSWIEIVIERPTGSTAAGGALEDEDLGEELIEPRVMTIAGYGPRWADGVLP
ncbi:Alanine racemase [Leucobacter soli]|uniref:Alanine racemase n=3 Tax=Leucobacter soli TaxID=2812850 RepID=A0A916JZ90_9MICO|nr:Alanine racemase [Leucobacter soli]